MTSTTNHWDGTGLGPGPIALETAVTARDESRQEPTVLVAASTTRAVFFELNRLGDFLGCHVGGLFITIDVAILQRQLLQQLQEPSAKRVRDALWTLTAEGRWVDLRILDRQVRLARGESNARLKDWSEIVATWSDATPRPPGEPPAGELLRVLSVFERLRAAAEQIATEAAPVPRPVYEVRRPEPAVEKERLLQRDALFRRILDQHQQTGKGATENLGERPLTTPPVQTEMEATLLGQHVGVWASVAFLTRSTPGFVVDSGRLGTLHERATEKLRRASALISRAPGLRECFRWSGEEVARNRRGHLETNNKRPVTWLRKALRGLCDLQNEPPDIPHTPNGEPSPNPEHWSFWAACREPLWAWREVYRMAELLRVSAAGVRPRYETVPRFRSLEPNLTVYRTLGVRAFRPRDGFIFLAGRLSNLRACCLAAVCVRRGYVALCRARLYQFVLGEEDPLAVAAGELYSGAMVAPTQEEGEQEDAEADFDALRVADEEQHGLWLWTTHALLETAPLGLPSSLLTVLLRNDYGLEDLREREVSCLQSVLARKVAYELQQFWGDGTYDLVTARLGLTDNEGLRKLVKGEDLDEIGRSILNDLRERRQRSPVMHLINERLRESTTSGATPFPQARVDLAKYRSRSLGGCVTQRAASAAVRRQEVLTAAEEVVLAVAHDLTALGYSLLGVTDSEFVLEVPERATDEATVGLVGQIALNAANRVLGACLARVEITRTQEW